MKEFEVKVSNKEVAVAQLRIYEKYYEQISVEDLTKCVNHFIKVNDVDKDIVLDSKKLYRDVHFINPNNILRFSTKDNFITITYIRVEPNYVVVEIEN